MSIYNSKIFYVLILSVVLIFSVNTVNESDEKFLYENKTPIYGNPIATTSNLNKEIFPLILKLNKNPQSTQIQKQILKSPKKTNNFVTQNKDGLNNYLINIFCTEIVGKNIKAASGSGIFLSNPDELSGIILTNAHVARHLLNSNKKCVGRTNSPTITTHTLTLRYIPYNWLDKNNQYVIGDTDQSSTGEFDFAIIESTRIKPLKKSSSNIYDIFKISPKLKLSDYDQASINNVYIYSYPAQKTLSKNIHSQLFQKKDLVTISTIYSSPSQNIKDSLIDVVGSKNIEQGSSGGMVISQGYSNSIIGLSSVLIKDSAPQIVRVVTMRHILSVLENDLKNINNIQIDPFLKNIKDILNEKEIDTDLIQILKNINLTSSLEQYTRNTLYKLNILR